MLLTFVISLLALYAPVPAVSPILPWYWSVLAVGALTAVNALACWSGARLAGTLYDARTGAGGMQAVRIFRLVKLGIVGLVALEVFALRWPLFVQWAFAARPWLVPAGEVVLLLPLLVMVLTAMAFEYHFQRTKRHIGLSLRQYLLLRFRTEIAILLVPWLLLALSIDVAYALWGGSEHIRAIEGGLTAAMVVGIVVFGPWFLRSIWQTSPLPAGPLRERLEAFCRTQHFRCRDILVWHTYGYLPNAGVVGLAGSLRYVLLTDALLADCTPDEVEAVFAHEVGHVRQHHFAFYILLAAGFMAFYVNAMDLLAGMGFVAPIANVFLTELGPAEAAIMLTLAALYWVFAFGYISRRLEQQADIFSLRTTSNPAAFLSAMRKLGALSGTPERAGSWRHFSLWRRTQFLQSALQNPERAALADRSTRLLRFIVVGLCAAAVLRLLLRAPALLGV